jgi:hypothetical protein
MSDLAAVGLLALVVVVVAGAGVIVGRMIATRIDRWQQATPEPGAAAVQEEPGDDPDPG